MSTGGTVKPSEKSRSLPKDFVKEERDREEEQ